MFIVIASIALVSEWPSYKELLAKILFLRLSALANLRENEVLANKKWIYSTLSYWSLVYLGHGSLVYLGHGSQVYLGHGTLTHPTLSRHSVSPRALSRL